MFNRTFFASAFVVAWLCLAHVDAQDAAVPEQTGKYRMWFTKTWGDDHLCLTEVEFYGATQNRLNATFVSMSSCYGCSTCDGCAHRYGNPLALFDGDAESDSPSSWACTAPGTFTGGIGSQSLVFTLNDVPKEYVLRRPQANGDWVTRDFSLEAEAADGTWMVIDNTVDAVKTPDQRQNTSAPLPVIPTLQNPPWSYEESEKWVNDYPWCSRFGQSPIDLEPITEGSTIGEAKLPFTHVPLQYRALANTGKGLQMAGKFGNLTLPGGVYEANQLNFHFPAEHRIGGEDHMAVGEMQIVFQKLGAFGADGLAIVSIMLNLPLETPSLQDFEHWFINMGMLAIPEAGQYSAPLMNPLDLSIFDDILAGNFYQYTGSLTTPPCTEGVEWFIMEKPAVISGVVVQQFKVRFPDPQNARPVQAPNGRVVAVNSLPAASEAETE